MHKTENIDEAKRLSSNFVDGRRKKMENVSSPYKSGWIPNEMEIFQHPMCLISAESEENEDGEETKIVLKKEPNTFEQIEKIDRPLVVVAVVGLYRTGKSYLMNRLADSSTGFTLGDTIESTTKGIWAWCKMHPERQNTVLLLLDTEGLGDVDKGDSSHDNKIFILATLLSNCLVYNMKGAFDNDAVSKLTFVTEMTKNIRFRGESSEDNKIINLILPDFVLCLRDFSLKLIKDGKKISENDYLEQSLAENKSKAKRFNKPRECIRKLFPKRECFAFPVPGDGYVLENLETLKLSDLSEKFKDVTTKFVSFIYKIPPKELLASKPVNGQMFVTLADRYVTAISNGAVPDVDDAFSTVSKMENARIEKKAVEIFENKMEKIELPLSEDALRSFYIEAQQAALDYLRSNIVYDREAEYEKQAQIKMDNFWNKIEKENAKKVREMCNVRLQELFKKHLEEKIRNGLYEKARGYRQFQRDVERFKAEYEHDLRNFKEHEYVSTWHGFLKSLKETDEKIILADEDLSQKEKEAEKIRNEENIDRLVKETHKTQIEALEKQKKDLESHHTKLMEDRCRQLETEKQRFESLVNEKFKMEKEASQRELERCRKEHDQRLQKIEKNNAEIFTKSMELIENIRRSENERLVKAQEETKATLNKILKEQKRKRPSDEERKLREEKKKAERKLEEENKKAKERFDNLKNKSFFKRLFDD